MTKQLVVDYEGITGLLLDEIDVEEFELVNSFADK